MSYYFSPVRVRYCEYRAAPTQPDGVPFEVYHDGEILRELHSSRILSDEEFLFFWWAVRIDFRENEVLELREATKRAYAEANKEG